MEEKKKFHLGRNPLTLIIALLTIVIVCGAVVIIYTYVSQYNSNKVTPFVTDFDDIDTYDFSDTEFTNPDDNKFLTVSFEAQTWNVENATAKFSLTIQKKDALNEETNSLLTLDDTYSVIAYINVSANWVGFNEYSSSLGFRLNLSKSEELNRTYSCSNATAFPKKNTKTWPISVSVEHPTAYVALIFKYQKQGNTITQKYKYKYTYDQYYTSNTKRS